MKTNRVAYGVRVKLNSNFEEKCLGDKYLRDERILFIADEKPFNDSRGNYVHIKGGSLVNSGYVYLNEIDLEFEVPEYPLYPFDEKNITEDQAGRDFYNDKKDQYPDNVFPLMAFEAGCKFKEQQIRGNKK